MNVVRHTANFEAMVRFYRDGLGMKILEQWTRSENDRGAVLEPVGDVSNSTIELLTLADMAVAGHAPVNVVLTMFVDDAGSAREQLTNVGIRIMRDLEDTPWGHRSFGVDDPDGLRIWIVQALDTRS